MLNLLARRASGGAARLRAGDRLPPRELVTTRDQLIHVPDPRHVVHLQFRRFAGCPVCKLHLRSIAQRHDELVKAGILEVAVFHSSSEVLLRHDLALPFAVVADSQQQLYREFGVKASLRSVLDPRAWAAIARGLATFGAGREAGEPALGLPADFLIGGAGEVLACKYGAHADDHWSVDEILEHARATDREASVARANHRTGAAQPEAGHADA
ncbi:AhpC/TSA family protein [Rhodanobacter glycinis]|uniref:AhpC/TSA family protein n=2 Tax=Rhodanobacter glycinis TaxID=582702 RepID=A0A502BXZ7_9GAMM|nr:peroxiredoxin-like family protein [Rhodanobacter glycinis]TPG05380.1 AhpC/TSA family protein [Rhodanobacter glycinis]TPG45549.1 AhpC/TSA family protein [Rhodanobacter glycinis]